MCDLGLCKRSAECEDLGRLVEEYATGLLAASFSTAIDKYCLQEEHFGSLSPSLEFQIR
jgi:hypothetical protein